MNDAFPLVRCKSAQLPSSLKMFHEGNFTFEIYLFFHFCRSSRLYGRVPLHVGQAGLFTNKYSKLPPGLVGWNACQVKGVVDEDWVQKVKDAFIAVEVRQSEDW